MKIDVIRAWKDEEYRQSLTPEEFASLPAHPAGMIELRDQELADASGGTVFVVILTIPWATVWGTVGWNVSKKWCK